MARIGLLGGAFNPPHRAHLKLAELAWAQLGLDELRFVPTAVSPHKAEASVEGLTRLRLLALALEDSPEGWWVEPFEVQRGGISYTVDTLESLNQREPGHQWILLLGSDQLAALPSWRRLDQILSLASVAVALRPGHPASVPPGVPLVEKPDWTGGSGELIWLPSTQLTLASSGIRDNLARGEKPEGVSSQVGAAIERENLYRG